MNSLRLADMKIVMRIRLFTLAAMLVSAFAAGHAETIQFAGTPTGVNDGNYYVLPYQITIDGTPQLVTCYDVYDDVYTGDVWQANLLTLNQAALSGFFSTAASPLAKYEEVAWLDAQTYNTPTEQIALQYAIWDVFGTYQSTSQSQGWLDAANAAQASGYAGFNFSGVRFIQQFGAIAGQPGTEQAFVYWASPPLGGQSENGVAPEPDTVQLAVLGSVFLFAIMKFRNARR